jgi:hypothetical protein
MSVPPVEGRAPEPAAMDILGATQPLPSPPRFSARTAARGALATTKVPASVDRSGPTPTQIPSTRRVPKHDTEVIVQVAEARIGNGSESAEPTPLSQWEEEPAVEPPPVQTPMVGVASRSRAGGGLSARWQNAMVASSFALPIVIGLAVIEWRPLGRADSNMPSVPDFRSSQASNVVASNVVASISVATAAPAVPDTVWTAPARTGAPAAQIGPDAGPFPTDTPLAAVTATLSRKATAASTQSAQRPAATRPNPAASASAPIPDDGRELLELISDPPRRP